MSVTVSRLSHPQDHRPARVSSVSTLSSRGGPARLLHAGAILLSFLLPSFSTAAPLEVVAGIPPVADLVRQVAGSRAVVRVLLPPGASPHTFEPTPSLVGGLSRARLFFQIGAGLESWAAKLVTSAGDGIEVITLSEGLRLAQDDPDHAAGNPHVWLDPLLAAGMVTRIQDALSRADPAGFGTYRSNAAAFTARLRELDAEIRNAVAAFRVKSFISFHPAWSYFASRYGLRQAGVIEESPGREPTPRQLAAIVAAIRAAGIRAVFAEPQLNPKAAEVIAREAGVGVVLLDPLGGVPGREGYLELMRWNLARMAEVMR